jgi:hypothetical protein
MVPLTAVTVPIVVFAGLALASPAARRPATAGQARTTSAATQIVLDRERCYTQCAPAYTVAISGDGNVVYEGKDAVRVTGVQRTKVDPAKVAALVATFQAARFFELPEAVGDRVTDIPMTSLSLTVAGRTKRVQYFVGAPAAVKALEAAVDTLANTRHWITLDAAAVREVQASAQPMSKTELGQHLVRAAEADDAELARALVDAGAPLDGAGDSPSPIFAVRSVEMVRQLVAAGAKVNGVKDRKREPPLVVAARSFPIAIVNALIAAGADPNSRSDAGVTPLMEAAEYARVDVAAALLKAGANARLVVTGKTALGRLPVCLATAREMEGQLPNPTRPWPTVASCNAVAALLRAAPAK